VGAVYVLSNQPTGNAVIAFDRAADGTLAPNGSYPTTGTGTGAGLGSQGAVAIDKNESHLYAVDAGSNSVTSFRIKARGLERVGTVPSGGVLPTSLTVHGNRLYVLNAGGTGNIAGFTSSRGRLTAIAGSTHALSSDTTSPAQVSFTPDGSRLVVTEKATSLIDVFGLTKQGIPSSLKTVPSAGVTPFGFDFDNRGHLLVSEAAASTASSYAVTRAGLRTISAAVPNTEAAACWLVTSGKFAYTGNAGGSLSISGYRVGQHGSLSLLTPDGKTATTAAGVTDLATSRTGRFLYSRLGDGSVGAFQVGRDGSLASLPVGTGLPTGAAGIAAR
jgi:6-phosphogluconolactonase (cycloisomerase 2 family)